MAPLYSLRAISIQSNNVYLAFPLAALSLRAFRWLYPYFTRTLTLLAPRRARSVKESDNDMYHTLLLSFESPASPRTHKRSNPYGGVSAVRCSQV